MRRAFALFVAVLVVLAAALMFLAADRGDTAETVAWGVIVLANCTIIASTGNRA